MKNTYEIFKKIIDEKGITAYRVAKDTGLTTVLFTDWKKGKSSPKFPKLKIIADYLGVSVEYLQGVDSTTTEDDIKVALFGGDKEVTPEMWQEVKDYVEFIKHKYFKDDDNAE